MTPRTTILVALMLLGTARSGAALDSADLLFHLNFDEGIQPEFARGSGAVATMPANPTARLVEGLFGKGYLFGGKASTIEYFTGGKNGRNCWEMYGAQGNLYGEAGTCSFWFKPLPNQHNMVHPFFRCNAGADIVQVFRDQYMYLGFSYCAKSGLLRDSPVPPNQWQHIAITWRKDEARGYLDGSRFASTIRDVGVFRQAQVPERFLLAGEGMTWIDFQTKQFADDMVMDEVQLFRRPLTPEEVHSLFERGHVTAEFNDGVQGIHLFQPEREYAAARLAAPLLAGPVKVDGDLSGWQEIPAHGCFLERRVGVLDNDPGKVYLACDQQTLYLAFSCPVDEALQRDPTHIWYPTGQFKADAQGRDADVSADDSVEFTLQGKDHHVYRFILNAKNALRDSRDGDQAWNATVRWTSRADFKDWTAAVAIPLADLGMAVGETVGFNAVRSWKLSKSSQNTLCADEHTLPVLGQLTLGAPAVAALESVGQPWRGDLNIAGSIAGPPGDYLVKVRGKGFADEKKIAVAPGLTRFAIPRRLAKPDDMAVVVEVFDPQGNVLLARTVPFVYAPASNVELINYPGWGRLDVAVVPQGADVKTMRATVSLLQDGQEIKKEEIRQFDDPCKTIRFVTTNLAVGKYQVLTRIQRDKEVMAEDRQPYEKKPLPEWYHCQAGIIDGPPLPWTDVQVSRAAWWQRLFGESKPTTVECLLKNIRFQNTLFPAEITANGQRLLARPIGLRVTRGGQEKLLTAGNFKITARNRRKICWESTTEDAGVKFTVNGWIEFDGFTWMEITLAGGTVDHVALEIPLRKECVTLKSAGGPLLDGRPMDLPAGNGGYWFGNEKAGLQYHWEHQGGWALAGESGKMVPANEEVVLSIPFIQKRVDLAKARTVALGWAITPTKPPREDHRHIQLDRGGVSNAYCDYALTTPNYARPAPGKDNQAWRARVQAELKNQEGPICAWYAYGAHMWNGAPEYAEWYREWLPTSMDPVKPDPTSRWLGPTCYQASSSDLQLWLLDQYVRKYPQRGIYFDCMELHACKNEAHGCGYVDDNGVRQPTSTLLAARRHYERIYNIIKAADPVCGWIRFHDWGPNMALAAFCDDNWVGEGDCGALAGSPGKNYDTVMDIPRARLLYATQWGHLTSWLTEIGKYGKMSRPPGHNGKDDPGEWAYSPTELQDHEHIAGLGLIHDLWQVGGNSLDLPWLWLQEIERLMRWDETVRFAGYWDLHGVLELNHGLPEKVVCSAYYRPAGLETPKTDAPDLTKDPREGGNFRRFTVAPAVKTFLRAVGGSKDGFLILAVMNNTDEDVTVTLKPNPAQAGVVPPARGCLRDIYRAFDHSWRAAEGWRASATDPGVPVYPFQGRTETFPLQNGAATVPVPKRNFRMLLLEPAE